MPRGLSLRSLTHTSAQLMTMASKKGKAAKTDEELSKLFEGIGDTSDPNPQLSSSDGIKSGDHKATELEQDPLAELASLAQQRPSSRPHTPKVSSVAAGSTQSPKKDAIGSGRSSEDKAPAMNIQRKSGESTRSFHKGLTPVHDPGLEKRPSAEELEGSMQSGGSWWGGIVATASAAVKTAEAAVKEIQQNEEAKKWAEQVKGNVGALRDLGMSLVHIGDLSNDHDRWGTKVTSYANFFEHSSDHCASNLLS